MSQSRKKGRNKVTIPCHYKRESCWREATTNFQVITCEDSGRVVPQVMEEDQVK